MKYVNSTDSVTSCSRHSAIKNGGRVNDSMSDLDSSDLLEKAIEFLEHRKGAETEVDAADTTLPTTINASTTAVTTTASGGSTSSGNQNWKLGLLSRLHLSRPRF
ncbi:hypothetical protein L2E82_36229 [Cichorium intybus]|uniref:Uncharacterized protein n=1 Tax=Cichorium intybus TaxID=13427 RepID=A0ACB9BR33_CICIN|nr:hypothetical protein L2E82_36229 [Cichorium intybus]